MKVYFCMDDDERDVALAIGSVPESIGDVPICPFNVGDRISFPGFPEVLYVVRHRNYLHPRGEPPRWLLDVAPARPPT